jgi:hypothetical protein
MIALAIVTNLPCDRDNDEFVWFSPLFETLCDWLENWIMVGGGECGLEQHMS